ncbi:hypothetical protein VTH8203_00833 [Vibrio thalassae]|uniref:Outer membrane lipoprotein BfpB n=1 Tax=Vibrio thalassae TaxID=1243014 RepID=A0A240EEX1_9VIBR|nr:hypothetical protein [Vibrio thalassae]SNX47232.1 hypothetical protein VTH8203_00833 [Vibrio thalassae]
MKMNRMLAAVTLVLLSGCTTLTKTEDFKKVSEADSAEIHTKLAAERYAKVRTLDRPPQLIEEIVANNDPSWFEDKTAIIVKSMPLSLVLKDVVGSDILLHYGFSVDPNKLITLTFEGTKREALNIISLTADYGFTAKEDSVDIAKFTTKTYVLPTTVGNNSFQIGSSSSGGTEDDALSGQVTTTGGNDGQYANTETNKSNLTDQIYKGIEKILNGEANITTGSNDMVMLQESSANSETLGYAEKIEGVSSIVVRTSPAMMLLIDDYVQSMINELVKSVELEVVVIEYQADDDVELGIDAQLKKAAGRGDWSLDLSTPKISDAIQNLGLGYKATTGSFAGSAAVINALNVTGNVSVRTQQTVKASNHMVQEIDLSSIQSYIATASTSFEGANNDIPTTSIERDEVRDGVKMLAMPSIQEDRVHLKLNGVLSKLLKFDDQEINGVKIRSPRVRQARFNITGAYEYNSTIIVTHMRQETNESTTNNYADIPVGKSGSKTVVDTLVLLTPRKVVSNWSANSVVSKVDAPRLTPKR